ncbi:hypothetical protein L1987_38967 [Smallanthus sonchifolius]|uniref:Uncharacterized protein n=1 Tax=Smallanthus sonchifolius TaxID=185202 RepID=A0ACB9HM20_9ASTR|nr:hypothetical protein L1987_38967 [Smallanthus sonchifolius]
MMGRRRLTGSKKGNMKSGRRWRTDVGNKYMRQVHAEVGKGNGYGFYSESAITFYLSNLPESLTGKELWFECLNLGHLVDAFIPSREIDPKVVLTFNSTIGAKKNLQNKDTWESIFINMFMWDGQIIPYERIAWVQVHGVPIQLWEGNTFDCIGQTLGKVVEQSNASYDDGNLVVDEIGVLMGNPFRISQKLNIEWKGRLFPVWIQELGSELYFIPVLTIFFRFLSCRITGMSPPLPSAPRAHFVKAPPRKRIKRKSNVSPDDCNQDQAVCNQDELSKVAKDMDPLGEDEDQFDSQGGC